MPPCLPLSPAPPAMRRHARCCTIVALGERERDSVLFDKKEEVQERRRKKNKERKRKEMKGMEKEKRKERKEGKNKKKGNA
jgi:hypothetical protein